MMNPRKLIGLTAIVWTGLSIGGITKAATFQLDPGDFAVLAGGRLETDNGVSVDGTIGGGANVWLGQHTRIGGQVGHVDLGGNPAASSQPIPEPASLTMLGIGALLIVRRTHRSAD